MCRKSHTMFRTTLFGSLAFIQLLRKIVFASPKFLGPWNLLLRSLLSENESVRQLSGEMFLSFHGFRLNSHFFILGLLINHYIQKVERLVVTLFAKSVSIKLAFVLLCYLLLCINSRHSIVP